MQIGVAGMFGNSPRRDFGFVKAYAQAAEELGFACLYAPEHVVFFPRYKDKYPYTPDGSTNWSPDTGIYDPLLVCAAAAMVTTTLRVCTSVAILPERPALLAAKEVMTLDHLSNGRFDFGVGLGWSSEEYAALGVPWAGRAGRMDEYIEAIRTAWGNDRATYSGQTIEFEDVVLRPAPLGTIKILIGGDSEAAMRRAARLGDGWYGWWASGELEPHLAHLHSVLEANSRSRESFDLRVGLPISSQSPDQVAEQVGEARRLGVDEFVLGGNVPTRDFDKVLAGLAQSAGL